jgi:hypothetical protein
LESTAIQIDSITAAIHDNESEYLNNFMNHANTIINVSSMQKVMSHFLNPYIVVIYTNIANVHIKAAINAHCNAFSHNVGLTLSSCININEAGIAQLFRLSTNSFADSLVNDPSICAVPPHILAWITGADNCTHHTNIAI